MSEIDIYNELIERAKTLRQTNNWHKGTPVRSTQCAVFESKGIFSKKLRRVLSPEAQHVADEYVRNNIYAGYRRFVGLVDYNDCVAKSKEDVADVIEAAAKDFLFNSINTETASFIEAHK